MQRRYARYPFLSAAREAVREADVDLAQLVAADDPAVERGLARVEYAVEEGRVGPLHRRPRTELLSYPVARVLVSLVDQPALTGRYAEAEARTAIERLREDTEADALRSAEGGALSLGDLLAEFDLEGAVTERREVAPGGGTGDRVFEVAVTAYLGLATDLEGAEWRLVNRDLADGSLPVTEEELYTLLERAVERRVAEGLPLDVPAVIGDELREEAGTVRELLAEVEVPRRFDTVDPEQFPPCVAALLSRVRDGERLSPTSRFALTGFLATAGMRVEEITALYGERVEEDAIRYQVERVRGEEPPTEYAPPSCATMQAQGDCVNMDERCETIAHPLAYYESALAER